MTTVVTTKNRKSPTRTTATTTAVPSAPPLIEASTNITYKLSDNYIETIDRRVFVLKPLYKSGVDHLDEETSNSAPPSNTTPQVSSLSSETGEEFCLICQEHPVSRALLPCRHVCSCQFCFGKLTLCPICRQPIASYFVVRAETSAPPATTTVAEGNDDDLTSMIQNEGIWSFIKSIWNAS